MGCFALDDEVLIVEYHSSILPGADVVSIPGNGDIKVGERISGAGGHLQRVQQVQRNAFQKSIDDRFTSGGSTIEAGTDSLPTPSTHGLSHRGVGLSRSVSSGLC